jgi:hypothetical protein
MICSVEKALYLDACYLSVGICSMETWSIDKGAC